MIGHLDLDDNKYHLFQYKFRYPNTWVRRPDFGIVKTIKLNFIKHHPVILN